MALTSDVEVNQVLPGTGFAYPVKGGTRIFGRALVGLTAYGFAVPLGAEAVTFVGIAVSGVDNRNGADEADMVHVERDCRAVPFFAKPEQINKAAFADDDDITAIKAEGKFRIGIITGQTVIGGMIRAVVNLGI